MKPFPCKILYAASTDGHLRSFHLPYLAALRDMGCTVTAAGAGDGHGLPEGIGFVSLPFTKSFVSPENFRAARAVAALQKKEHFDLVLVHTSLAAFFTRLGIVLAGKRGVRVVNTVHGYLFDRRSSLLRRTGMLLAEKILAGATDDILTMNAQDTTIARRHRLCRGRTTEIPGMGVPLGRYHPVTEEQRRAARKELHLPEDAFVLLCAAEFSPRKNQAMLIRSLALLPESVMLLLPGDGALREDCEALAGELGVEERVRFPGHTDTLPYLAAADLCVSASRSEGLPFHVMEAMGCALPSVLSRVKGHEDLLPAEQAGRLFAFNDEKGCAEAVRYFAGNAEARRAAGEAAYKEVQKYDLNAVMPVVLREFLGD